MGAIAAPRADSKTWIRIGLLPLEDVAALEADSLNFDRTIESVQQKLDLAAASDNDGNIKTLAIKKRHNTANGAMSATAAAISYPYISHSGGRKCPLG